MKFLRNSVYLALAIGFASTSVMADDLIGTTAEGKGGRNTVALDFVTSGESVAFEFVVALPKGATKVDVAGCMKGLPSTHQAKCVYNDQANEVTALIFSTSNAKLPSGALNLGSISYNSLLKGGAGATIRDLVVADGLGKTIQSEIRTEDALGE
jgi:hypothetical protein